MNLQPLNDRILVRVDPPDTKSGALHLVEKEAKNSGLVIAVGPGALREDGTRIPVGLKVGDHILFKGYRVEPIKDVEADKLMMDEKDVIAIILDQPVAHDVWSAEAAADPANKAAYDRTIEGHEKKTAEAKSTGLLEPSRAVVPQNATTMEDTLAKYAATHGK